MTLFDSVFEKTVVHEIGKHTDGGYTNDPLDPGGETKWGISKRANPEVDIKNLTKEGAKEIYFRKYWKPLDLGSLAPAVAQKLFDIGVNMGVDVAREFKQRLIADKVPPTKQRAMLCLMMASRYLEIIENRPLMIKYVNGWTIRAFS